MLGITHILEPGPALLLALRAPVSSDGEGRPTVFAFCRSLSDVTLTSVAGRATSRGVTAMELFSKDSGIGRDFLDLSGWIRLRARQRKTLQERTDWQTPRGHEERSCAREAVVVAEEPVAVAEEVEWAGGRTGRFPLG